MEKTHIIDINGKDRVIDSMKVIKHKRTSAVKGDNNKPVGSAKYVECNIIGDSGREWTEYYPLKEFKKNNPEVSRWL